MRLASMTQVPKLDKDNTNWITIKKNWLSKKKKDNTEKLKINMLSKHWCKNPQQNTSKPNSAAC